MVKTLLLIRHANAEDTQSGGKDFDRHLTRLGQRNAAHAGKLILAHKYVPDMILCSKAARAKETAEIITSQIKFNDRQIKYHDELYDASVRTLFTAITEVDETSECLAVIAHNPGLTYLADYLTEAPLGNMVPASIVVIKFDDQQWTEISQNSGEFIEYIDPEPAEE